MTLENYVLPDFWMTALVNGDYSGMDDKDAAMLDAWLNDVKPGRCVNVICDPNFYNVHDANGYALACNCVTYVFQKSE